MTQACEREKCFLKPPRIKSSRFMNVFIFFFFFCLQVLGRLFRVWNSEVHDGFLAALLPSAVRLQGNQSAQVQLGVTGMRELRIRVSSACCRRPGLPDVAVTVLIWVGTHTKNPKHIYSWSLRRRKCSSRYTYWLKTRETSSFTNHW